MDVDLTCRRCHGSGVVRVGGGDYAYDSACLRCEGIGHRPPTLAEYDALRAERDRLVAAIQESCEDNRDLMLAEGRTAMCPLAHDLMAARDRYKKALEDIDRVGGYAESHIARKALDHGSDRTKTGKILADDDFETLADEAERGYDVSKWIGKQRRKKGSE